MLTQNADLKRCGIWNWTLPAWVAKDSAGRAITVCPSAGACVSYCYARNGTYNFPAVKASHVRNLERVRYDLANWTADMMNEVGRRKFRPTGNPILPELDRGHLSRDVADLMDRGAAMVRIHDSGDFFSEEYLIAWMTIAHQTSDVIFYAYTKQVSQMKRVALGAAPANFLWCYSIGGREDHLVDRETDYHADVFPDEQAILDAGYYSQHKHDLLCVVAPTNRVGIPANNIRHYKKRMAGRTFGQLEADRRSSAAMAG